MATFTNENGVLLTVNEGDVVVMRSGRVYLVTEMPTIPDWPTGYGVGSDGQGSDLMLDRIQRCTRGNDNSRAAAALLKAGTAEPGKTAVEGIDAVIAPQPTRGVDAAQVDVSAPYNLGLLHGATAVATGLALGATMVGDSEGAEVAWEFAPRVPYEGHSRDLDAYMDGWYEAVHAALTTEARVTVRIRGKQVEVESWRP